MNEKILNTLNEIQKKATLDTDGAVLVLAGAGSGKTRVLTYRIANLIANHNIKPSNILAVTFTNKASNEMKERLLKLAGESIRTLWVGTFHSMCVKMLREYGDQIGLNKKFTIYDDYDQTQCIKKCIESLCLDKKRLTPKMILPLISKAKETLTPPEEYYNVFGGADGYTIEKIYKKYIEILSENQALDFDDLIFYGVKLLKTSQKVREHYQNKFKYIHVDEYQDINQSQYSLISILAEKHGNIFCVGDDDQSIYGWRGADVSIILKFEKDYPKCKIYKLEQNYRSTKKILKAAYEVIKHNTDRNDKIIWTDNKDGINIELINAIDGEHEAQRVASSITAKVSNENRSYSDFVILYRANAMSRSFEKILVQNRIPYRIVGGLKFYDRAEIKDIIAYLKLLNNPKDNVSLLRIINTPARGIGDTTISRLESFADENGISLLKACKRVKEISSIKPRSALMIEKFVALINHLISEIEIFPLDQLLKNILDYTNYRTELENERTSESKNRLENIDELYNVASIYNLENENPSLNDFLEQITLSTSLDTYNNNDNAVTLMTVHAAKGLEFPCVYLVGLEEGIFPHQRSATSPKEIEEERRLMYVAMTRAEEELVISYCDMRATNGQYLRSEPSSFLSYIPQDLFGLHVDISQKTERKSITDFKQNINLKEISPNSNIPSFKAGNKITHKVFGKGIVLNCQGTGEAEVVTVVFDKKDVGIKKLLVSAANLEIV